MWITNFVKAYAKSPLKMIKGLAKYAGRAILRRTGVFGIYGTAKKYKRLYKTKKLTKWQAFVKATGNTVKKNLLRMAGPLNYLRDWHRKGFAYMLKQFAWNQLLPMQVKKIIYLNQNFKNIFGRSMSMNKAKYKLWETINGSKRGNVAKLNQIERIMRTKYDTKKENDMKRELLNGWFVFYLNSPQSGNFGRSPCQWNPITKEFIGYIWGWPKKWTSKEPGTRQGGPYGEKIENNLLRQMLSARDYGKFFHAHWHFNAIKNKYVRTKHKK